MKFIAPAASSHITARIAPSPSWSPSVTHRHPVPPWPGWWPRTLALEPWGVGCSKGTR